MRIVRNAVRILLLNKKNELLLMCLEDFDIATIDGKKNKRFWCTIGGGIKQGESLEQAALQEIHEETGIQPHAIKLGPIVWKSTGDCKPIKGSRDIWELRIDFGAGYRIYFGRQANNLVILLIGGDKGTQTRDIERAKRYWRDYKE